MANWSLPDALSLLHQQFPGAYVTSGARDPNSALGRANPKSYHNVGEAFDIRPMAGVSFDNYVSKLKAAGLPVVEAKDEAKHPLPWTTGPNWHIAFSGDKQVATNPIDLIRRAQAFNVNIPQDAAQPAPMSAAPAQAQGFDLQGALARLAAMKRPLEQKKNIPDWAKIVGALGDAYGQVHGRDPVFLSSMMAANKGVDERNLDREKLNAQIDQGALELAAKLAEPPQFIQNALAWQGLTPEQKRAVLVQQDAVNPINVSTPQGTQNVPRTQAKVVNGKTYYSIGGQWYEEGN